MLQLVALVDYFNVVPVARGASANLRTHLNGLEEMVSAIEAYSHALIPRPSELRFRLYGGWFDAASRMKTNAREILGAISRRYYPTRGRFRVFLEPADSLLSLPGADLTATVRTTPGLVPFMIDLRPPACVIPGPSCHLSSLRSWQQGRCPNHPACSVRTSDVCSSIRQKLVDTALVADMFTAAQDPEQWVLAVSNDDDIVPGVIAASRISPRVNLVRLDRRMPSPYDDLLKNFSIQLADLRS